MDYIGARAQNSHPPPTHARRGDRVATRPDFLRSDAGLNVQVYSEPSPRPTNYTPEITVEITYWADVSGKFSWRADTYACNMAAGLYGHQPPPPPVWAVAARFRPLAYKPASLRPKRSKTCEVASISSPSRVAPARTGESLGGASGHALGVLVVVVGEEGAE
eukprot:1960563-Rhodomonas_salina.1